ncbi:MAG: D-alanyl-lipoteichoic acid acyltransferase DltB, superfamily, partial [Labilithrix sp.]|nr:D-alanyl-lipoteichoic acid acyltransferase DltB, superfamily [Labilithrix sp.]
MLFNSFTYLLRFLPVVVLGHILLRRFAGARASQVWLLAASLFFYAFPRPSHLPLLLGSIVFNWGITRAMVARPDPGRRKAWLWVGLLGNIGLLASFKYVNFALGQVNAVAGTHLALPNWDFPLGISFFTLTQVMYLVDCYQEMNAPISLLDHASVVSFFPYVSSGPIVRAKEIADQFAKTLTTAERDDLARRGLYLLTLGLAKKVVFADTFAAIADIGFASVGHLSTLEAWVFSLAYTFRIYFDFSGYSDMAVGTAWLLGFEIPQNFDAPYRSQSISEFWQRWHISLSNFITNYLYTPILRSFRKATLRTSAIATLLAMGIAGLWHGPAWTYIVFGLIHGVSLAVNQYWKKSKRRLPRGMGWLVTFLLVNAAFVVFRSPTLGSALTMLGSMIPHGNVLGTTVLETA